MGGGGGVLAEWQGRQSAPLVAGGRGVGISDVHRGDAVSLSARLLTHLTAFLTVLSR